MIKRFRISIIILLLTIVLGLAIGRSLPSDARIPVHWNIEGEVDNTVGKTLGLMMLPGISLVLLLFFIFFPWISPRYRQQAERFDKLLPLLANIMLLSFGAIYLLSILLAKNAEFDGTELMWVLLGLLFILLGNLMPKLPSSFFIGIRTPWTLSSEEVWRKTHRVGGKAFAAGGIFFVLAGVAGNFLGIGRILFYALFGMMVIYPVLYSYLAYRRVIGKNKSGE